MNFKTQEFYSTLSLRKLEITKMCLEIFREIPDVVWSGIIASVITLLGVLLVNGSNTKRLRIQLKHDAEEKAKERTATLRREVYFTAAEELTKTNSYLGSLSQIDLTKTNLADGLQGFLAASSKLQLVAEPETALLVNRLVGMYGELFLKLIEQLVPLSSAKSDIAFNDEHYAKASSEVQRVLSEMTKFNESAQTNDLVFDVLNRSFEEYQSDAAKYSAASQTAWKEFNRLNAKFLRLLLVDMKLLGKQQIRVLVAIRRDLGLTSDLLPMQKQMEDQLETISGQIDKLITGITND